MRYCILNIWTNFRGFQKKSPHSGNNKEGCTLLIVLIINFVYELH